MDIALNTISSVTNIPKRKEIASKKLLKKSPTENGFSFKFTKTAKVKAIVAKKRAKPSSSNVAVKKNEIYNAQSMKKPSAPPAPPKNYVLRPPDSSENEDDSIPKEDINISLHLAKGDVSAFIQGKKKKLTRYERLKLKRENRHKPEKVLSTEEIKEGLKKFSKPPKKKTDQKPPIKTDLFENNPETKIMGQKFVKPVSEKLFTGVSVSSLGLHPHCVKNLKDLLNITELTQVQQKTIPRALEGKDILVRSQTGSGKTLAYALPIVQKLQEIRPKLTRDCGIQAVIIVPTRELAIQTYELFLKLLKPFTWIVAGLLSGGEKRKAEKARLRKGINILVGTSGRLLDHLLHTETFRLDKIKWLILDEADLLLELGYERDVKKIVDGINNHKAGRFKTQNDADDKEQPPVENSKDVQRLLLSATLTPAVQKLAGLTLVEPLFIDTSDLTELASEKDNYDEAVQQVLAEGNLVIPSTIQLSYVLVPPKLRLVTLAGLLAKESQNKKFKALLFMSTMEMVNYHHDLMNEVLTQKVLDEEEEPNENEDDEEPLLMGLRFFKLHGSMTQQERSGVFKSFREVKSGILLTTDVACRGIDVPEVDLVIQYSPPQKIADFVHRVGRTARAGKSGRAISFLGPNETEFIEILQQKRIRISQVMMEPYLKVLHAADSQAHTAQEAAANLQHKFQGLLNEDKEMHEKACKAFVSWIRYYSTFPKELKHIFNAKTAHMGHYAKSFALQELPKNVIKKHNAPKAPLPTNRLTYTERDPKKMKLERALRKRQHPSKAVETNRLHKYLPKSISLTMSEFDSGLPALKKKKK